MLDALLSRLFGRALESVGGRFEARILALAAFLAGLAAVPLIARHFYAVGLVVFLVSRIIWALAAHGRSGYAAAPVLEVLNFAALPFGFALADPTVALAAVLMMFGLSAVAMATLKFGRGWMAPSELVIAFAIVCIVPERFGVVAYATAVLCFISAGVQIGASGRSS